MFTIHCDYGGIYQQIAVNLSSFKCYEYKDLDEYIVALIQNESLYACGEDFPHSDLLYIEIIWEDQSQAT